MKVRSGFVSNSSSSSFVISRNEYPTVFELAFDMIGARDWPTDDELREKCTDLATFITEDVGVFFKTCNYDTYIFKHNDEYFVTTCNNHDWSFLPYSRQGGGNDYGDDDEAVRARAGKTFVHLDAGTAGRYPYDYAGYCSKCWSNYWLNADGEYFCPGCGELK